MSLLVFIDSGILWRALDPEHPERRPCLNILRKCFVKKPEFMAGVNSVIVIETMILLVQRSKIVPKKASILLWEGFLKSEDRVIAYPLHRSTLKEALELQAEKPHIEFPDCVIAASMNENGILKIYTTNPKHFVAFNFVKEAIDPRRPSPISKEN